MNLFPVNLGFDESRTENDFRLAPSPQIVISDDGKSEMGLLQEINSFQQIQAAVVKEADRTRRAYRKISRLVARQITCQVAHQDTCQVTHQDTRKVAEHYTT